MMSHRARNVASVQHPAGGPYHSARTKLSPWRAAEGVCTGIIVTAMATAEVEAV
jgi:hypothetical protein